MQFESLKYEVTSAVAEITLNRPERLNALTGQLREEITTAFGTADADAAVRAVVITGAGRGFCSGADLGAGDRQDPPPPWSGVGPVGGLGRMAMAIRNCSKPTIAAVNGAAAGAGLAIALACDVRIASELARFAAIFVRRGIMPDTGCSFLLPQVVRLDFALKMLMTGEIVDASKANEYGLCTEVVSHEALLPRSRELATQVAAGAPIAIGLARKAAYLNLYRDLGTSLVLEDRFVEICNVSDDQREGVQAFLEKREPMFTGR